MKTFFLLPFFLFGNRKKKNENSLEKLDGIVIIYCKEQVTRSQNCYECQVNELRTAMTFLGHLGPV